MRYYFDIQNGHGFVADEEGLELPDPEAARNEALTSIRAILSDEVGTGVVDLTGHLHVRDQNGAHVMEMSFSEAVELRLPH
jgi:hypothetical protein